MSILVGSARVAVVPDVQNFGSDLKAKLAAELKSLGRPEVPVSLSVDDASLLSLKSKIDALGGAKIDLGVSFDAARLTAAMGSAQTALNANPLKVRVEPDIAGGAAASAATGAAARTGRGFGWGLFGATIGGIGLWHVALDLAVESLIAVGTASAAASTGVAALAATAGDLTDHLTAVHDVNSALGGQIPGLDTQFSSLQHSMAPQGIELYGAALHLVTGQAGAFSHTATEVVNIFDDWAAKIDLWSQKQDTFGALLHTGTGYLQQLGHVAGDLGIAVGNLLRDDPGIARFLVDALDGAAKLLDVFTSLPAPIVTTTLALHGLYTYGNIALGLLGRLIPAAKNWHISFASLARLTTNPFAWAVAAAAGVGYLAYEMDRATPAAQSFINAISGQLGGASASSAILLTTQDLGKLEQRISQVSVSVEPLGNQLEATGKQIGAFGVFAGRALKDFFTPNHFATFTVGIKSLGDALDSLVSFGPAQHLMAANDLAAYNREINNVLGSQRNLFAETGHLMSQGYSYSQSLALMDLAGVKAGDSFDLMRQKVANLIGGYEALSIRGGILSNSVNAITFATDLQDSQVSALTGAWSQFFTLVSGGESGFDAFIQQISGSAPKTFESLNQAMKATKGNFSQLNSVGAQARSMFVQTAQAGQTEMNNLMQLASAAGLGARGTNLLGQASRDMLVQLLPAARGSQAMTTILYALAQQGGYQGADSFRALSHWVGHTANPMKNLQGIVTDLTVAAGNLTTDVKNLSTALGTTLNQAISSAIFYANGGQKAFDAYAGALVHGTITSGETKSAATRLAEELISVTGNTNAAHREFDAMTIALGYTKGQADNLWRSILKVAQAEGHLHNKTISLGINEFAYLTGSPAAMKLISQGAQPGGTLRVPLYASGTMSAAQGWAIVGENGPEMVNFRGGEQVEPLSGGFGALAGALTGGPGWRGHELGGGSGGGDVYNAYFDGWTAASLESRVRAAFQSMSVAQGKQLRLGRRS